MNSLSQLDDFISKMGGSYEFVPPEFEKLRFFVLGESKTGKSHALAHWTPEVWQGDIEGKAHSVQGRTALRIPLGDASEKEYATDRFKEINKLDAIVTYLEKEAKKGNYPCKHFIFDSIDKLQDVYYDRFEFVEGTDFQKIRGGKGAWGDLATKPMGFPRRLYRLGIGWTMVSHLVVRSVEDYEDLDQNGKPKVQKLYGAQCTPKMAGLITNDAEYILIFDRQIRLNKTTGRKEEVYVVETQRGGGMDSVFPVGGTIALPKEIVIPVSEGMLAIRKAYYEAAEKAKANTKG